MRKRYKKKIRSCPLCKPHKTGHAGRWSKRDLVMIRVFEREQLVHHTYV
ncbi:hypothetical protein HY624_02315 [Candidatus Uhrbacteria bacterium]|nr:hypothetical protein [Candidatus Uhrbacteria bacterium]